TARSTSSWPRSYSGVNPRRVNAADSPARSPVRSASSRSGSAPADPTRRSSSPTSSRRSAHELPCTEEVHLPGQFTIFEKSHSAWSGAPRHVYAKITTGVSSTPVKDGGLDHTVVSRSCELEALEGAVHDAAGLAAG